VDESCEATELRVVVCRSGVLVRAVPRYCWCAGFVLGFYSPRAYCESVLVRRLSGSAVGERAVAWPGTSTSVCAFVTVTVRFKNLRSAFHLLQVHRQSLNLRNKCCVTGSLDGEFGVASSAPFQLCDACCRQRGASAVRSCILNVCRSPPLLRVDDVELGFAFRCLCLFAVVVRSTCSGEEVHEAVNLVCPCACRSFNVPGECRHLLCLALCARDVLEPCAQAADCIVCHPRAVRLRERLLRQKQSNGAELWHFCLPCRQLRCDFARHFLQRAGKLAEKLSAVHLHWLFPGSVSAQAEQSQKHARSQESACRRALSHFTCKKHEQKTETTLRSAPVSAALHSVSAGVHAGPSAADMLAVRCPRLSPVARPATHTLPRPLAPPLQRAAHKIKFRTPSPSTLFSGKQSKKHIENLQAATDASDHSLRSSLPRFAPGAPSASHARHEVQRTSLGLACQTRRWPISRKRNQKPHCPVWLRRLKAGGPRMRIVSTPLLPPAAPQHAPRLLFMPPPRRSFLSALTVGQTKCPPHAPFLCDLFHSGHVHPPLRCFPARLPSAKSFRPASGQRAVFRRRSSC
ncbi:hypothetical protein TvY486_0034570, partial [Trypanosoma vivax Y486]